MFFYNDKEQNNPEGQSSEFDQLLLVRFLFIQNDRKVGKQKERQGEIAQCIAYPVNGQHKLRLIRIDLDSQRSQFPENHHGNTQPAKNHHVPIR